MGERSCALNGGKHRARGKFDRGWSAWAANGRAVVRNIFLHGNTWRRSPSVTKKTFVAELSQDAGLAMGATKLTYTHVHRTEAFDGQKGPQMFGSVSLSVTF